MCWIEGDLRVARNKKLGKVVKGLVCVAGVTFAGMYLMARKKKSDYTYKDEPAEQNPFAGKKVVFVQDDNDEENADGVRGHLEAVGVSVQQQSLYSNSVWWISCFISCICSDCARNQNRRSGTGSVYAEESRTE